MTCDICRSTNERRKPEDDKFWISFSVEDAFLDRSFHDKDICPSCVKTIQANLVKYESKPGPVWRED